MELVLPPLPPNSDQTKANLAWSRLRADIVTGVRPAGEKLRIGRLRVLYGIGPTPLREALQRLSAEGLVCAEGNRGFTVAPLDADEFVDLTVARTAIERECLQLSIARGDRDWEAKVVAATYVMARADSEGIPGTDMWEKANTSFHEAMVSACGSTWLLRVRAGLQLLAERYRRASVGKSRDSRDLAAEHKAISEAVLKRDVEHAVNLTSRHYEKTAENLPNLGAR